jgi:hypothetical protein
MRLRMYHKVSQSFRGRADEAAFFEAYVAAMCTREGLYCLCHPWAIDGEDHGETWDLDFSEQEDAFNGVTDSASVIKAEVKSLNVPFATAMDYPYPTILVCSMNSWNRKWPGTDITSRDFLFVCRKTGCIAWLPSGTPVEITEIEDRERRGYIQKTMVAASANLRSFEDFVNYVKASS